MSKKVVLKVDLNDDKIKKKAMKTVSGLPGVESVSVDMKDQKLTLIGETDPVSVVGKLRKLGRYAEIVSVGPAKEEKKKEEPKKEEPKKAEGGDKKKDQNEELAKLWKAYEAYHYQMRPPYPYYGYTTVEENPNACVIC